MMNEILGRAQRFQDLLTRKWGITGGAPSPQLTPEITPGYDMPVGAEDRVLASDIMCSGGVGTVGAAANKAAVQIRNPTGSNLAIIVERAIIIVGTAQTVEAGIRGGIGDWPNIPAAGYVTRRDTRQANTTGFTVVPAAHVTYETNTPPSPPVGNVFVGAILASSPLVLEQPVVLSPGWSFGIICGTVATYLYVSFAWREVPMAQGEAGPF
jgi:hypothetical protein